MERTIYIASIRIIIQKYCSMPKKQVKSAMKALQVNTFDLGGGAEKVVFQINNELNKKSVHSDLLVGNKLSSYENVYSLI